MTSPGFFSKLSKDVLYRVDKVAEGVVFLPACCSSVEAELRVVHELIQHVNHLVTRKRKLETCYDLTCGVQMALC